LLHSVIGAVILQADVNLITLNSVQVNLGGAPVLTDISLAIDRGEFVTFVGPNGAGKSTLLKAIVGLTPIAAGERRARGVHFGYVPQQFDLNPALPMRVRDFLALARCPGRRVSQVLEDSGAEHLLDRPMQGLSGGERQRALLARALLADPDVLALDEPDQGLDLEGQQRLHERLRDLHRNRGLTILLVSHDLHYVMAETTRVYCINRHLCCEGTPDSEAIHGFLRHYQHHHDHTHTEGGLP
jgi:zinc transport system ATP-binding protein